MTSATTRCGDWLTSTHTLWTETKVEPFGLSLWSQRKTNPKNEMTQYVYSHSVREWTRGVYRPSIVACLPDVTHCSGVAMWRYTNIWRKVRRQTGHKTKQFNDTSEEAAVLIWRHVVSLRVGVDRLCAICGRFQKFRLGGRSHWEVATPFRLFLILCL